MTANRLGQRLKVARKLTAEGAQEGLDSVSDRECPIRFSCQRGDSFIGDPARNDVRVPTQIHVAIQSQSVRRYISRSVNPCR